MPPSLHKKPLHFLRPSPENSLSHPRATGQQDSFLLWASEACTAAAGQRRVPLHLDCVRALAAIYVPGSRLGKHFTGIISLRPHRGPRVRSALISVLIRRLAERRSSPTRSHKPHPAPLGARPATSAQVSSGLPGPRCHRPGSASVPTASHPHPWDRLGTWVEAPREGQPQTC